MESRIHFCPHFGWKSKKLLAEPNASYQDRKYGLFFQLPMRWEEDVACRYPGLTGALRTIAEETIRLLLEHTEIPLEEAMEAVLTRYGETEVLELSRECLEAAGEYIDFYVRIYARNKVIRALLNAGITVTVCGRNWSEFPENETERAHLQILGEELPYEEAIEVMADSKVVLNVMPWFKDGSHERIAMGSMNGAVCVTDANEYVSEVWGKQEWFIMTGENRTSLLKSCGHCQKTRQRQSGLQRKGSELQKKMSLLTTSQKR